MWFACNFTRFRWVWGECRLCFGQNSRLSGTRPADLDCKFTVDLYENIAPDLTPRGFFPVHTCHFDARWIQVISSKRIWTVGTIGPQHGKLILLFLFDASAYSLWRKYGVINVKPNDVVTNCVWVRAFGRESLFIRFVVSAQTADNA